MSAVKFTMWDGLRSDNGIVVAVAGVRGFSGRVVVMPMSGGRGKFDMFNTCRVFIDARVHDGVTINGVEYTYLSASLDNSPNGHGWYVGHDGVRLGRSSWLDSTPAASKKMYDVLQRLAHELNRSDSQLSVLLANAQRKALAEGAKKEVPRLEEEVRALEEMLAARRLELEACERLVQVVPESLVPATRDMVRALYRQMVQDGMPEGDALASALVLSDGVA